MNPPLERPISGGDAIGSQIIDLLQVEEIKETGNRRREASGMVLPFCETGPYGLSLTSFANSAAQLAALAAIFASITRRIKRFVRSAKAKWSARQLSSSTPTP